MVTLALLLLLLGAWPGSQPAASVSQDEVPAEVYHSTDCGATWLALGEGLPAGVMVRGVTEDAGTLYANTVKGGVYVLEPGATTWQQRSAGLPVGDGFYAPLTLLADGDTLILGTFDYGTYISHDGGAQWHASRKNVPDVVGSLLKTEDRLLAGTHGGLFESHDAGETWQRRTSDEGERANALITLGDEVLVAKQNGVGFLRADSIAWTGLRTNYAIIQFLREGDYFYAITARNEVYRTRDGHYWEQNSFVVRGLSVPRHARDASTNCLGEALWNGYEVTLPGVAAPAMSMTPTSRGWVATLGGGC